MSNLPELTPFNQFVQDELRISTPQINDLLEQQAGRYAYWAALNAEAQLKARNAKLAAQVTAARIYGNIRNELISAGHSVSRAVQEAEAARDADPQFEAAWKQYNQLQYEADVLEGARIGFMQRKDLLITIAANLRGEMGGQARLVARQEGTVSSEFRVPPPITSSSQYQTPSLPTSPAKTGNLQSLMAQYLQQ